MMMTGKRVDEFMNNGFPSNPYMTNPYNNMSYMPSPYGSPQSRIQSLEQQKRDIDNQISMLQSQVGQPNLPPININNQIAPNPQQANADSQMNSFDFNGRFIKNEDELKQNLNNTLPVMFMSSDENKFYIRNMDGTISKYKFEEYSDEPDEKMESDTVSELKRRLDSQETALNRILGYLQGFSGNSGINMPTNEKISQNGSNKATENVSHETSNDKKPVRKRKETNPNG